MRDVAMRRGHIGERPGAFGQRAHGREHAAHVRVMDDRDRLLRRAIHRAALHALLRVGDRLLVSAIRDTHALHAHREACRVHHDEHVLETAILLADQMTDCATVIAKLQDSGWARLDAELVFDRHAMHVIALATRTILVDQELRHDKQRNALDAFRRIRRTRQHEMDDVLRHVVLAPGDENLGAEHLERAIALRLGTRTHEREIGARLRLGEVHRAGPFAGNQLGHIGLLLRFGAGREQRFDGTVSKQRT